MYPILDAGLQRGEIRAMPRTSIISDAHAGNRGKRYKTNENMALHDNRLKKFHLRPEANGEWIAELSERENLGAVDPDSIQQHSVEYHGGIDPAHFGSCLVLPDAKGAANAVPGGIPVQYRCADRATSGGLCHAPSTGGVRIRHLQAVFSLVLLRHASHGGGKDPGPPALAHVV